MRKLPIPPETKGDERATEMMRVWLAHNDLHVSLMLGMWEDAEDSMIQETEAWGRLLADTVQHIANGLSKSHGFNEQSTVNQIRSSFLEFLKSPEGETTGDYVDEK